MTKREEKALKELRKVVRETLVKPLQQFNAKLDAVIETLESLKKPKRVSTPKKHEPCSVCNDTGVWETGNNDLPCPYCKKGRARERRERRDT